MNVGPSGAVGASSLRFTSRWLVWESLRLRHPARSTPSNRDDFGRMFHLPAFAPPSPEVQAALAELGKRGGLMDANDNLAAGPIALIVDPALSVNNPDSAQHTAGVTFMGQFLDHDMTFDTTSQAWTADESANRPQRAAPVLRSRFGVWRWPRRLATAVRTVRPRQASGGIRRTVRGSAARSRRPGDHRGPAQRREPHPRRPSLAFLLFHNRAVDLVRSDHPSWPVEDVFAEARRLTTWHYQWVILHEFLPRFVGSSMVNDVLANGRRFYLPKKDRAFIPVEFQIAYRFGHSMVRPSYRANFTGNDGSPFFAMVFDAAPPSPAEPADLRGGCAQRTPVRGLADVLPLPRVRDRRAAQQAHRHEALHAAVRSAARRDSAGYAADVARAAQPAPPPDVADSSGQAIAAEMGAPVLNDGDLAELGSVYAPFVSSTPLWYYILKEADFLEDGAHLGPVGGRLVAEVFIGLLQLDSSSYLNAQPDFTPSLGSVPGSFQMTDFLTFAGVAEKR